MIVHALALNSYELLSLKATSFRVDTMNADCAREDGRSDFAKAGVDGSLEHHGDALARNAILPMNLALFSG